MEVINIILITISVLMILEGLLLAVFPKKVKKAISKIFKNQKKIIKIGLIEIILALLILFIISL